MVKMNNKLVIKENFDEADLSDDVDDEVFVRDGKKNMVKIDKQKCDEQPLMPARKKLRQRQNSTSPEVRSRQPCNIYNCLLPVYFALAAIISIAFLMLLYIFLVDKVPVLANKLGWWKMNDNLSNNTNIPCNNFQLSRIWAQKIPKLLSDSQIEMVDIDRDGIDDVIIGTGTEIEDATQSVRTCDRERRYGKRDKCLGGLLALNGKTGSMLWKLWLTRMVLGVHCDLEITSDGVPDCVVTGENGLLIAVSGATGELIWEHESTSYYNVLYNVLVIGDVNDDGSRDILASQFSTDSGSNSRSSLLVISGRNDEILQELRIPEFEAILHAPQVIMNDLDGSRSVIFVTGGPQQAGGLYGISMSDLLEYNPKSTQHSESQQLIRTLYHFDTGILAAPTMVDVNSDGVDDIIFLAPNTTFALDGYDFHMIWNVSLYDYAPKTHSILATSSATPTYFNSDEVPDLLITFSVGSEYPTYYYSVIIILNGKNGQSLMETPIIRSGVADVVGGISISFSGPGNDAFLYWVSSCKDHVSAQTPYEFITHKREAFADVCNLRFNSSSQLQLFALNQHVEPPGVSLRSEYWHESWDYDIRENLDVANEQATLLYRINTAQDVYRRPHIPPDVDNGDDGQYAGDNERTSWKVRKNGYSNNGPPVVIMNDLPEQPPNIVDYGSDSDIPISSRNEKDYDLPSNRIRIPVRLKRNPSISSDVFDKPVNKMIPKVSASGALTKSFDGNTPGLDLVIMHHEVLADPHACLRINGEQKCSKKNAQMGLRGKDQPNFEKKEGPMSNIYISRYRMTCNCVYLGSEHEGKCAKILPYEDQSYPTYQGPYGNSAFRRREHF